MINLLFDLILDRVCISELIPGYIFFNKSIADVHCSLYFIGPTGSCAMATEPLTKAIVVSSSPAQAAFLCSGSEERLSQHCVCPIVDIPARFQLCLLLDAIECVKRTFFNMSCMKI